MDNNTFPLIERKMIAEGTTAFWFDTIGTGFSFEAGQNADFTVLDPAETDAEGNTRTFSFASSPVNKDRFMVATRMRPTAFKNTLKEIPIGTKLLVVGPLGNMTLHEDSSRPAVFLAGGIGITPFRSMVESSVLKKLPHAIHLFYSNRTFGLTAFHADFERWAKVNVNFRYHPTLTDDRPDGWNYLTGKIDAAMLKDVLGDLAKPIFYIAGQSVMVIAIRKVLLETGVSKDTIKLESFSGY